MPITAQQKQQADNRQTNAAQDRLPATRILAGPGTGKSRCIAKRVDWLLRNAVSAQSIYVISFTRATVKDLTTRIIDYCTAAGTAPAVHVVHISTMHSLALSALRRANLLTMFAAGPVILDEWEQQNIFDKEYAERFQTTPSRAKEIRLAFDAFWQTLQQAHLAQISTIEQQNFQAFYGQASTLYSCILPGEVVRRCVEAMRNSQLDAANVLACAQLVVDEFQDLNACDQEFINRIALSGAVLWIAGDDDQSIYGFRHADPTGIQTFPATYPGASTHALPDCFRCSPAVVAAGTRLVRFNPSPPRIQKGLVALYASAAPPVHGQVLGWGLPNGGVEARAIAQSCRDCINGGLEGEDILILLANRRAQLVAIQSALDNVGVPYTAPKGPALVETTMGRLVLAALRIVKDREDYAAHRDLLGLVDGVGTQTCLDIANAVVTSSLNFRDLFYAPFSTQRFTVRSLRAIAHLAQVCRAIRSWGLPDRIADHDQALVMMIGHVLNPGRLKCQEAVREWRDFRSGLPDGMTLEDLLNYLQADNEVAQLVILQDVQQRLGVQVTPGPSVADRVRILTMHGAKGLEGKVVFIPGFEQEIIPGRHAAISPGLLQEQRRLLYVSITRAKAACILTRASQRSGAQAQALISRAWFAPAPSQFQAEVGVPFQNRASGLSANELQAVLADCATL